MSFDPSKTMVIRSLTPHLTTFSMPFLRFGKIKMGIRATAIKLSSGNLAIFSPVPWTSDVEGTLKSLGGNVNFLIAPDYEHHMSLGPWKAKFPNAVVIAVEGLREKRAKQGNEDIIIDVTFGKDNKRQVKLPEELAADIEVEYFDAHANKEIVVLHREDKTLITADLMFNLPPNEQFSKAEVDATSGFWQRFAALAASINGNGQQRFLWHVLAKDKASFSESAKMVNTWSFNKIIVAHGDVIETGGKELYEQLFAWHL